jgi:hypothetical protein
VRSFRIHWPAIVVAMIASFLFEAAWYSYFLNPWVVGIGRTREWLMSPQGINPAVQYGTALLCSFIAATVLSISIQISGPQTIKRGIACGTIIWFGFIATGLARNYIFEVRPVELWAINAGYGLIEMILIGAIVGGWKGKARSPLST